MSKYPRMRPYIAETIDGLFYGIYAVNSENARDAIGRSAHVNVLVVHAVTKRERELFGREFKLSRETGRAVRMKAAWSFEPRR